MQELPIVFSALVAGGLIGWIAARAHPVIGPIVGVALLVTILAITIAAAAAEGNSDLHLAYGLFVAFLLLPLWAGTMITMTWTASRRAPVLGPKVLGLLALAVAAGLLALAAATADGRIGAAYPGLAHLVIAFALLGTSWTRRLRELDELEEPDESGRHLDEITQVD